MCSVFARILSVAFRISFWVLSSGFYSVKRPVFVAGIELFVPYFRLHITGEPLLAVEHDSFLHRILRVQCHERCEIL